MRRGCLERSNSLYVKRIRPIPTTWPSRRNLTDVQRYRIGEKLRAVFESEAKERQREHGGTAPGKPKNTLPDSSNSEVPVHTDKRIAKETDLSRDKVQKMRKIENESRRSRLTLKSNKRSCI